MTPDPFYHSRLGNQFIVGLKRRGFALASMIEKTQRQRNDGCGGMPTFRSDEGLSVNIPSSCKRYLQHRQRAQTITLVQLFRLAFCLDCKEILQFDKRLRYPIRK